MYKKITLILFLLLPVLSSGAQEDESFKGTVFFIAPLFETTGYGRYHGSVGGGLYLGAGDGISTGVRLLYAVSNETPSITLLEVNIFLRLFILDYQKANGLFVQLSSGPVIYTGHEPIAMLAKSGSFSGGLSVGWRFPFGKLFFIEPEIRGGYPFIYGAGVSAGVRF